MAKIVVLAQQGIEPAVGRYDYLIQGDPSVLGLTAAVGSLAIQVDSVPPFAQWNKLTTADTGWSLVVQSANAGASSATGSYRVSAYSVPVDGTTDATATINTLTGTTMPQTGGPYAMIVGPGEIVKTASSVVIPATVSVQGTGGVLKPAAATVVTLVAQPSSLGQLFDTSLGGTVVMGGQGNTVSPVWWGADKTGAADSTAAVLGAINANFGLNGGKVVFPSGKFLMTGQINVVDDRYSYLVLEGDGPGSLIQNGTPQVSQNLSMIYVRGNNKNGMKQVRIRGLRLSGVNSSDYMRLLAIDNAENVRVEDVYLENNACEGIVSFGGEDSLRKVTFHNCHATNVGGIVGSAAFNFNAQIANYSNCSTENCGNGIETQGRWTSVNNCIFYGNTAYSVMLQSTWSGYLDAVTHLEVDTYGGIVQGCQFVNTTGYGIYIVDYFGHPNSQYPTYGPQNFHGGIGHILIQNNLFDRCNKPINGGSDLAGPIECSTNDFTGQYDAGTGPQQFAIAPMAGTWNIHNNKFSLGKGIQWQGIIGYAFGTPKADRVTFLDNEITNRCWFVTTGGGMAQFYRTGASVGKTRFIDLDGTIAANPTSVCYSFFDAAGYGADSLAFQDFDWTDPSHTFSLFYEPSLIPTLNGVLPPQWSYKPGDTITNKGASVAWTTKRCTTGGTLNPVPLTITATGTSGSTTITLTDATKVGKYQWISFPGVPSVTNKQILSLNYVANTVTVQSTLEATVTGGSAVSWATPVFVADRDLNTMTLPAQATGDIPYASSATALTRLAKGLNGQTLSLASGVPAWISALPRADSGNSSTAITLTYTDAAPLQKVTLTAAAPVITIAGIPSGGYFEVDVFQDATGGRTPTWAQTGMGSLAWTNGNVAPTITPTASISDRLVFHNDGTRCIGNIVWQNA